jgi:drug/metabolite transporter (DMT)-like permease
MKISKKFKFTIGASTCWAIGIILSRIVMSKGENAYNLALWAAIFASPYWIFSFSKEVDSFKKLSRKGYLILFGTALISTVGISIVEAFALKYSPATNYSFLIRTTTLFTIVFAYIFLGEKITSKKIIIAILILTGAYLLTTGGQLISLSKGDIFTLADAALIAFGNNLLGKMATNLMSTKLSSSASFLFGIIPIFLIALFNGSVSIPTNILLIILLALLRITGRTLRFNAYKHASASYVTMVYSFTPVLVSILSMAFLGESLTLIQMLGGLLIIIASISVEKLKI